MFWNIFKSAQDMNKDLDKKIKEIVKPWQDDIVFLESMQKLEVKDGDIIVLHPPYKLSRETTIMLQNAIEATIRSGGFNTKVMVLEDGMDIGILRKENNDKEV